MRNFYLMHELYTVSGYVKITMYTYWGESALIKFDRSNIDTLTLPVWAAKVLMTAPAQAVKLYIYGLLRGSAEDISQISAETLMSESEVLSAMDALKDLSLLETVEDASLMKYACAPVCQETDAKEVYNDKEYNELLQALFSDRVLSHNDYKTFYEIRDVYGLPVNVVLMLCEHCIKKHKAKNRVPMIYLREKGREWAKDGIDTIASAEERMYMEMSAEEGLKDILTMLGISRKNPTSEEQSLYNKWTRDWGFSISGIRAAMAATTAAREPSMKYLDGILRNLMAEGKLTGKDISEHFADKENTDIFIKKLLSRLGAARRTVTDDMRKYLNRFKSMGFGEEEMNYAASSCALKGNPSFEYMNMLLTGWRTKGLVKITDIKEHIEKSGIKKEGAKHMLALAGISKEPSKADIDTFERMKKKYGMSEEIVFFAAECAYGMNVPLKAMEKILENWHNAGVKTLEAAKAERDSHRAKGGSKNMQQFDERSYSDKEYQDAVYDPLREMLENMEG